MTDFSDSGVIFDFVVFVPLFFVLGIFKKLFKLFIGINDHGAEFVHFKEFTILADTGLGIDNPVEITGAKVGKTDNNIEWNQKDNADKAKHYVESAFKKNIHFLLRFYNYTTFGYIWLRFSPSQF